MSWGKDSVAAPNQAETNRIACSCVCRIDQCRRLSRHRLKGYRLASARPGADVDCRPQRVGKVQFLGSPGAAPDRRKPEVGLETHPDLERREEESSSPGPGSHRGEAID